MPRRSTPTFPARTLLAVALAGLAAGFTPALSIAQPAAQPGAQAHPKGEDLLRDFIHFTRIARYDVAASYGKQLLDQGLTPVQFVDLVENSRDRDRFEDTIGRAMRVPDLEATAGAMLKAYERGKLDRVRDPKEITRNIGLLTGVSRARLLARERLVVAGEYALPQLLGAVLQRNDLDLQAQSGRLLVDMGRQAIIPLCTALAQLDPTGQETVVDVLGRIEYRTSLPFLVDLRATTTTGPVREACTRAIGRITASGAGEDAAELYRQLAEGYYEEKSELTSFPFEEFQLLWSYQPSVGLSMSAIRTEVFHEAMAMRMSERSLALKGEENDGALSLWIASNFSREIDTPKEYQNPAYASTRRDAMYYAVAAGAGASQSVLARAIDHKDTPLARRAISAIEQTAGGSNLWAGGGDRRALLEALRYPNRRVQYEAALALSKAQPTAAFDGSERVVPILASAIRDAGDRYAVVIAKDNDLYKSLRSVIERAGYAVLPFGSQLGDVLQAIAETPGIDLIVSSLPSDSTSALIADARSLPGLGATPILALTTPQGYLDLSRQFDRDVTVAIRPSGLGEEMITRAANDLVMAASGGPITATEARDYSVRSLAVLRDLAVSGNAVFAVGDAVLPLISSLGTAAGPMRLDVAEVLSRIDQKRAQVALMDAAMTSTGAERVALLGKVADSAKRFGNLLEARQVDRAVAMATTGADQEATAAAALMGALNLPNADLIPLILGTK